MPAVPVETLRTIAFVGHSGSGKTTLVEALLFAAGATKTLGTIERGTTVCDHDPMERELGHSIKCAIAHIPFRGLELNLLDTPGLADFAGHAVPALRAADMVAVVVNAAKGIELTADRMMKLAGEAGLCRMVVVNRIDSPAVDLPQLVEAIRERWGKQCLLLDIPAHDGKDIVELLDHDKGDADLGSVNDAHRQLVDQLVEEDEDLLARFLEEGKDPTAEELHAPFEKALREGHLVPIVFTSAKTGVGVPELLHVFQTLAPNPAEGNPPPFVRVDGAATTPYPVRPDAKAHALGHVWKTWYDPYLGKMAAFRVHQGTFTKDQPLYAGDATRPFKAAHLYRMRGKELEEVDALGPGEIGAIAKIEEVERDMVLHDHPEDVHLRVVPVPMPKPMYGLAVETKKKTDEQRMFEVLHKIQVEDACVAVERHPSMRETVLYGLGDQHMRVLLEKLSSRYHLELDTRPPRVPYRETITKGAEGHCRHKKQTGGAGQFGEVYLRVEPLPAGGGFEFVDAIRGGVIPGVFLPAIEKGVRKALTEGVVAGFPIDDVKVTVYDGKTHAVDGKEIAFFSAGRKAALEALAAAGPIVLEPMVTIEIAVGDGHVGAVTSEIATRNGHITRVETVGGDMSTLEGVAPLAELGDFGSRLKSLTAGGGSYNLSPSHYAPVAAQVQDRLAKGWERAEEEE
jgi:elongation factor G